MQEINTRWSVSYAKYKQSKELVIPHGNKSWDITNKTGNWGSAEEGKDIVWVNNGGGILKN